MGSPFERGLLHFRQQRWDAALSEFQSELGEDPECARSRAFMALCLVESERLEPALELARAAVGKAPEDAFAHAVLAGVLHQRDELAAARSAIDEALRLDPEEASYWGRRAAIRLDLGEKAAALADAEHGLSLDPENTTCQNIRSMALVRLGRKDEARQGLEEALRRAPEEPITHANAGWTLLQQGDARAALASFHEALRLDPGNEWAREGLLEALRARYFAYRWLFRFQAWLSHLSPRARWGVILGGYFGAKLLRQLARANPELLPWVAPLVGAYLLLVVFSWVGRPLANALLLFHRTGRAALARGERVVAQLVAGLLAASQPLFGLGLALSDERWLLLAAAALCLVLPLAAVPLDAPPLRRRVMIGWAAFLALGAVTLGAASFTSAERVPLAALAAFLPLVGGMLATWIATAAAAWAERRARKA
jgi:tetratricopeptide (TPR) repeat protein